jgi:cytochrome P450
MRFTGQEESPLTVQETPPDNTPDRTAPAPARRLPPTPRGRFLVENARELVEDPASFLSKCAREYGNIVRLRLIDGQAYLLNHPDAIKEVLVTKSQDFIKVVSPRNLIRVLAGNGLLSSEGEFWLRQRRLMQPAFHRSRVVNYGDIMIDYTDRMLSTWQDGETRDIHEEMMGLTLAIVIKALFDADAATEAREIAEALAAASQHSFTWGLIPTGTDESGEASRARAIEQVDRLVYSIIRQRRASNQDRGDLLSMLLHAQDIDNSHMTDQQLRDEIVTLFLAGHETTATCLSWTWYLLSQYPEVEAKLLAEIHKVLGNRAPTVDDIPDLHYTELVVHESMRLYPPVWFMSRNAVRDTEIMGYHVPAGTIMLISQWVTHRDPRYFDNADACIPERWDSDLSKRLPRFAYFPFGGGARLCIGQPFAMIEVVLLLARIAQQFRLTMVPGHPIKMLPLIALRPKYGLKMRLSKR